MEAIDRIDDLYDMIETARAVPMSNNCMVNRYEMLAIIDELRSHLPSEIRQAQALLDERDAVLIAGQREAERIISVGESEHARLVSAAEVTVSAEHEAARIVNMARAEAQKMRDETQEYIDKTLANFEKVLQRTISTVQKGRDRLQAMAETGGLTSAQLAAEQHKTVKSLDITDQHQDSEEHINA